MKVLITGAAGFIGFHHALSLIRKGFDVVGIDNINDYYEVNLKFDRLLELGIDKEGSQIFKNPARSAKYENFTFVRMNLEDAIDLENLFKEHQFDIVCNLAAQAGVRYSLENPKAYIDSNIVGFANILECCRTYKIKHLLYASSSSVYGANKKIPFETSDNVDMPISLYAATKKSNELMAHTYSHLYKIRTTGLRFFTVYGPWGRPDMAIYLFTKAIFNNQEIKVFNEGNMSRDFTYIDDIVNGMNILIDLEKEESLYNVYNIGNGTPQSLGDFITEIEKNVGQKAKKVFLPIQPGDVENTWADVSDLQRKGYKSGTNIDKGIKKFVDWYKKYYDC